MTRRSRTSEHGLEKRGKPIVLPLLALAIALGASFADRQAINAFQQETADVSDGLAVSAISGIDNGTAVTCERHPLITHCFRLTQERR